MNERSITLHSPRLWASYYDGYLAVPEGTVYRAIDALRTHVAEWDAWVGDDPADHSSRAGVADAAQALADLMDVMARRARQGGIRELVRQIQAFMEDYDARTYLDALRLELQHRVEVLSQQLHLIQQSGLTWTDSAAKAEQCCADSAETLAILDALIALHEALQGPARPSARWRCEMGPSTPGAGTDVTVPRAPQAGTG